MAKKPQKRPRKPAPRPKVPVIRLLPVTIFVAVLMLSVRVSDIWKGIADIKGVAVAELQAQQPAPPTRRSGAAPAPGAVAPVAVPPAAELDPAAQPPVLPPPLPVGQTLLPQIGSDSPDGTTNFTQNEIDLLQKLTERREGLESRSRELDMREALLKAAEGRIEKKVTEMKTLQGTIEGLLKNYNQQEDTKMKSLVKIYENMKPKEAARIFEQLDMPVLLDVVERMKEQRVAPIMAEMDPMKAKSVTSELASKRQFPVPGSGSGG